MKWIDLPPVARAGIVAAALLTAGLAAISVALSYDAAFQLVRSTGLYSTKASKVYPVLLDIGFLIAESTAIVAVVLRPLARDPRRLSRFWPYLIMIVCGVASIWINILHAGAHPSSRLVAALPPLLMMASFQLLVTICWWTSNVMGVRWGEIPAVRAVPERLAWSASRGNGQTGHDELGVSKAEIARQLCRSKTPAQLAKTTDSSLVRELRGIGVEIDSTWASRALSEVRTELAALNGQRRVGERG